ncbi:MAG: hypothetical protein H6651_22970 [Ardenticatenales bacterium]|nr:hypothetical protein [Ardenticatenales bacterium]
MADSFRQAVNYQWMAAANGRPTRATLSTTRSTSVPDDPIVAGLSDFAMHSEQYYMHVDRNEVLATTNLSILVNMATLPGLPAL